MITLTTTGVPTTTPMEFSPEELRIMFAYRRMDDIARGDMLGLCEDMARRHPRHTPPSLRLIARGTL